MTLTKEDKIEIDGMIRSFVFQAFEAHARYCADMKKQEGSDEIQEWKEKAKKYDDMISGKKVDGNEIVGTAWLNTILKSAKSWDDLEIAILNILEKSKK